MQLRSAGVLPLERGITLLEASAGTGKTHSITNLFLRLVVEHGVAVERILVVTFTEAATAELRDRIRLRLRAALPAFAPDAETAEDEDVAALVAAARAAGTLDEARGRLERALAGFDEAGISTIHGFCRRVLQENAFESGADFDAELVADIDDLLREVVEDFWVREVHDAAPGFVRHLAARGIDVHDLLDLARKVAGDPDPDVRPAPREADEAGAAAKWRAAFDAARAAWSRDEALAPVRAALGADALYKAHPLYDPDDLGSAADALDAFFAAAESGPLPKAVAAFGQAQFAAKTKVKQAALTPRHSFYAACDDLLAAAAALESALDARALQLKHALVAYVREALPRRKQAMHVRSFDDLLAMVRDALDRPATGDALAASVRARYDAALIDEFQDTDPVQWAIFRRLFGDGHRWLYLIGDPKQAIYAFRGADIFTYLDAKAAAHRQQDLDRNWRSDARLVHAVNHLFTARSGPPFVYEGIPFRRVEAIHADDRLHFPGGPRAPLRLRILTRARPDPARPIPKGDLESLLPPLVAAEIAELLASGATIATDKGPRPVVPGDVAVLVRKNRQARVIQEALRARGIPAVLQGGESVFASPEALELERILAALSGDSRRVRAALATDLLGVDAQSLAAMETDEGAWEAWLDRLRDWRRLWADHGFMRLFRALLADLRLPERLLGWDDGERRLTNLLHLAELLHAATVEERLEPAGLVRWLDRQRHEPGNEHDARKLRLETDADAVEIVTVHASKGLQYPVVWCPYLWDGARTPDAHHLRCHEDRAPILDIEVTPRDPVKQAHAAAARREAQAEDLRLLYVALTRARHHCVVYWGLVNEAGTSPLAYLLHRPDADDPLGATTDRYKAWKGDDSALVEELRALAASSDGCVEAARANVDEPPLVRYTPPPPPRVALDAAPFDRARPLDRLWRRSSFSQMRHHGHDGGDVRDDEGPAEAHAPPAEGDPIPLAALPGGNLMGTAIHKVLEQHDFTDRDLDRLRRRITRCLRQYGQDPAPWTEPLAVALTAFLETPLDADGLRLRDVPRRDRLSELTFDFPVAGARGQVTREALADVLRAHLPAPMPPDYPDRLLRLGFPALRGFLTGNIDLVFRRGGRWYLADHKTNYLGDRTGHYEAARLPAVMAAQHYFLQYHLYAVALHRFLAWRLPGYDPALHFGGVYYFFVRGMDPASGPARGVFFDRPAPALLDALSDLMTPPESAN